MSNAGTNINYLKDASRYPKETVTPVTVPTVQVSAEEWNKSVEAMENMDGRISDNADFIDALDAVVNGGEYEYYESIKANAIESHQYWRIYGTSTEGESGKVLAGDASASILAFAVSPGDKIRMTGLKNSDNNPSLCWAVYSEVITLATDSTTAAALQAAFISSASDDTHSGGRSDVNATVTMPSNAAMLVVSIPVSDDASTIEKRTTSSESGLVTQMSAAVSNIASLQNNVSDLQTNVGTLQTNVGTNTSNITKLSNIQEILKKGLSTNVKSLISTERNSYGLVNNGRIKSDGIIAHGSDGCTTYIIALSAFSDLIFSMSGMANSSNNASLCWAVFNIAEDDVDWDALSSSPYQLDWSSYLMSAYSDTTTTAGRSGVSKDVLDLNDTGATFLVVSTLTASADNCDIRNFNTSAIDDVKEGADKGAELVALKNVLGLPANWDARTTATSGNSTATMTLNTNYANIVVTTSAAASGTRALWLGFRAHGLVAGHKYMMVLRYKVHSDNGTQFGLMYYSSSVTWSGDGYPRTRMDDDTDFDVWKYDVGSQYFTAAASGNLWIDFIVRVSDTVESTATDADFDIQPMLIDITDTDLTADQVHALIEKTGPFFDTLVLANYAINPLRSPLKETMIALGDSTTGMMMWQPYLARIKGWDWDAYSNSGREFNGVGYPYTAMGIGGTCVEPVIYGDGTSDPGCSQYIRARYIKYYEPTVIFVMSSYNGAHNGEHWGGDSSMPVQPDDYGLADLIASGMNYETGTYNGTYTGEEVDLLSDPSQDAPSFAAAYFGMIYRIITDNPSARIVLITLMSDFLAGDPESMELKNAVIEHAAEVFHLPLIDARQCGINRTNRLTTRYSNGTSVHFNEAGGLLLAKHIAANC